FVSIPVWFDWEASRFIYFTKVDKSFNSSMVRLGVFKLPIIVDPLPRFNSSMVRLGAVAKRCKNNGFTGSVKPSL
ncbi:MAG: hypothetical protein JXR34_06955, partial [Bacteroidales bacterium]|nr:hypothetical protein [Bacteroidales bacterium]